MTLRVQIYLVIPFHCIPAESAPGILWNQTRLHRVERAFPLWMNSHRTCITYYTLHSLPLGKPPIRHGLTLRCNTVHLLHGFSLKFPTACLISHHLSHLSVSYTALFWRNKHRSWQADILSQINPHRGPSQKMEQSDSVQRQIHYRWLWWPVLLHPLNEFLLGHAEVCDVRQVWDEGVAGSPADVLAASQVQEKQGGQTLQVGQTAVRQVVTAWRDRAGGSWL